MTPNPSFRQVPLLHRPLLLSLAFGCVGSFLPTQLLAGPVPSDKPVHFPAWWFERDVIKRLDPPAATPLWASGHYPASDDFATVNEGQLKTMVAAAVAEMNSRLPDEVDGAGTSDGAGRALNNLVASWNAAPAPGITREDFAAVNVGQLKAVSSMIYGRLRAVGYPDLSFWSNVLGNANDYAAANLGQVKYLLSFDPSGLQHDRWTGITGTDISTIPLGTVPGSPGSQPGTTDRDNNPLEDSSASVNYGERFRGYLVPPASGVYRFWLLASGTAQLYISNDDDPVNSILRASVTSSTDANNWTDANAGKSTLLWLEKGKPYHIEVRHKAGTGGNHIKVGWLVPTTPAHQDPINVTTPTQIIPASALWNRLGKPAPVFTPPAALTWTDSPQNASNPESHKNYNAAVRFLTQATYGPSGWLTDATYDINDVWTNATAAGSGSNVIPYDVSRVQSLGFEGWINEQMNPAVIPQTRLHDYVQKKRTWDSSGSGNHYWHNLFYSAWWRAAITGRDQLRQRVAFALSQTMVISNTALNPRSDATSDYYDDALAKNAFGNFRTILKDVTLHPAMGLYLNMLRNEKPDADPTLVSTARVPNENYARELLQLFSIGMHRLNPDGSLLLNSAGKPVPTYDQKTVEGIAHIFTGWDYEYHIPGYNPWFYDADLIAQWNLLKQSDPDAPAPAAPPERHVPEYIRPMISYPGKHFTGQKRILNNEVLPGMPKFGSQNVPAYGSHASISGLASDPTYVGLPNAELDAVLDSIFNHPNCGPFICRQLIQRLVTSNPSPGYVYRVVAAFNNDGTSGIDPITGQDRRNGRGNMDSVVKAILLDHEARSASMLTQPTFGKQREPVLRITALARAFPSTDGDPAVNLWKMHTTSFVPAANHWQGDLNQTPLGAPSVFNFYRPDYQFPQMGADITTPEFQLTTGTSVINQANFVHDAFFMWPPRSGTQGLASFLQGNKIICMDLTPWMSLMASNDLDNLIDELNKRLMAGQFPAEGKQVIKDFVTNKTVSSSSTVVDNKVTITTSVPHTYAVGDRIMFHPAPVAEQPRKTHVITAVPTANSFTIAHDTTYTYPGRTVSTLHDHSSPRERLFTVVNLMVNSPDFIIQR
ncbi:DUF1800 family protein [Luteolibacter flavescens]|uniref:DUF1800 family protein n=1 Tax=Luteolibacter flavescens TaxID=1859460 RepID=A0ABT3FN87_9BACT|nr:DUF1800 family protein [Luteolibacter flavescens]MCW1885038.1 DUF1800 family protein [Luteolibacter flavescens]